MSIFEKCVDFNGFALCAFQAIFFFTKEETLYAYVHGLCLQ